MEGEIRRKEEETKQSRRWTDTKIKSLFCHLLLSYGKGAGEFRFVIMVDRTQLYLILPKCNQTFVDTCGIPMKKVVTRSYHCGISRLSPTIWLHQSGTPLQRVQDPLSIYERRCSYAGSSATVERQPSPLGDLWQGAHLEWGWMRSPGEEQHDQQEELQWLKEK
jgi:hypothetical protein